MYRAIAKNSCVNNCIARKYEASLPICEKHVRSPCSHAMSRTLEYQGRGEAA